MSTSANQLCHADDAINSVCKTDEGEALSSIDGGLISRNVTVGGHRTSVRLEKDMWAGLREICQREHASLQEVCTVISDHRPAGASMTAAIRVFVMAYFRSASTEEGHNRAGHGPGGAFMMGLRRSQNNGISTNTTTMTSKANNFSPRLHAVSSSGSVIDVHGNSSRTPRGYDGFVNHPGLMAMAGKY